MAGPAGTGPRPEVPRQRRPPRSRRQPRAALRRAYGAGPLQLLGLLASFVITAAAVAGWFERPHDGPSIVEWFVAAIVAHDLVLLPLYSTLDRLVFGPRRRSSGGAPRTARTGSAAESAPSETVMAALGTPSEPATPEVAARAVRITPYVRIPTMLSLLVLAVFFPVIFGLGARAELTASGIPEGGYLARWLLMTGLLYAGSALAYAAALRAARNRA